MTNEERLKEISQEIERLQKEATKIREEQEEFLEQHWLTKIMTRLDFELEDNEIWCYDDEVINVYYLHFRNEEDIEVTFYGNSDLNKVFFYEVTYSNFSTSENYTLKELFEVMIGVNKIVDNIKETRKIMHKEFPQIEDFSDDFEKDYKTFIGRYKYIKD